jgi:hypothetical protein
MLSLPDGDHLTLLNVFDEYQNSMFFFIAREVLLMKLPHRLGRSQLGME